MGTNVYANNNEISSKAAKGKSSASFPDPCWSPPPPPTGPIVIPYPNTAKAKTLKKGTRTVVIKGTMVAKKDISYFAKSSGNEPATKVFQKGFLTRTIKGKAYYIVWSQNVKFEGKGVARHNDKMTHNHGSMMGNTPPNGYMDMSDAVREKCEDQLTKVYNECEDESVTEKGEMPNSPSDWMAKHCEKLQNKPSYPATRDKLNEWKKAGNKAERIASNDALKQTIANYNRDNIVSIGSKAQDLISSMSSKSTKNAVPSNKMTIIMSDLASKNPCITARRCILRTYSETESPEGGKGCCPGQTGHHLIPAAVGCQCNNYNNSDAPTICAEGVSNVHGSHGNLHQSLDNSVKRYKKKSKQISYPKMRNMCINSAMISFPDSGCTKECFEAQLDKYYEEKCTNTSLDPKSGKGGGSNTSSSNNSTNSNKNKR